MPNILSSLFSLYWLVGLYLFLVTQVFAAVPNEATQRDKATVHIGIYAPFSNDQAFIGRNILGSMELARERLQSPLVDYSFYTLDQIPDKEHSIEVLQQFINTHHINVLLSGGQGNGKIAAFIAEKNNLIHFNLSNDPSIADGKNNFQIWSPSTEQAAVFVKELQQRQIKHIGVITSSCLRAQLATNSVLQEIQAHPSIHVTQLHHFKPGAQDFSDIVKKVKGVKADLLLIMAEPEEISSIQLRLKSEGIDVPITSIVERVTPAIMKVFNHQWYVDAHEMNKEFVKAYKASYSSHPVTEAGYAYDVFNILHRSAIEALKKENRLTLLSMTEKILAQSDKNGVMGPYNFNKKGMLYSQSEVKRVNNDMIEIALEKRSNHQSLF